MPYASLADLPDAVKKLPRKRQRQWRNVFNSAFHACQSKGGADCETSAVKQAWGVVGKNYPEALEILKASEAKTMRVLNSQTDGKYTLSFPIAKVDEEKRMVYGYATLEALDSQGDIVDYEAAKKAFGAWRGNVREQHDQKKAVGHAVEITPDDEKHGVWVGTYVSKGAPETWEKVLDKTLKDYSIGVPIGGFTRKPELHKTADGGEKTVNRLLLSMLGEVSLVDQGACPGCEFQIVKSADGALVIATDEEDLPAAMGLKPADAAEPDATLLALEKLTAELEVLKAAHAAGKPTPLSAAAPPRSPDAAGKPMAQSSAAKTALETKPPEPETKAAAVETQPPAGETQPPAGETKTAETETATTATSLSPELAKALLEPDAGEFWEVLKCGTAPEEYVPWVPLNDPPVTDTYRPRTFGDVYEDTEMAVELPKMIEVLKRVLDNIISSNLPVQTRLVLAKDSLDEFFAELTEDGEEPALTAAAKVEIQKYGRRNSNEDQARVQKMHDTAVELGAECQQEPDEPASGDGVMAPTEMLAALEPALTKTFNAVLEANGLQRIPAIESQLKLKAEKADVDGVKASVDSNAAALNTSLAKVTGDLDQHKGELGKVSGAVDGIEKRLKKVEDQPAMPVVRPDPEILRRIEGVPLAVADGAGDLQQQIDALEAALETAEEAEKPVIRKRQAILMTKLGGRAADLARAARR